MAVVSHVYYIDRYNCTLDFSINYVWHDNCELRMSSLRASGSRSARGPSSTVDPFIVYACIEATKAGCYVSPVCGHSGNI